jgi:lipoprotein-anchoring transpeptidase ErfK/SrfK
LALRNSSSGGPQHAAAGTGSVSSPAPLRGSGTPVRIRLLNTDGATYGVGMPVVAYFSRKFANAASLSAATSITVNGKPAQGAWYFERSEHDRGYPVEGHLRLPGFWPPHATVRVTLNTDGVSGGPGFVFANNVQLSFTTGPRTIALVLDSKHRMYITSDGKSVGSYPVSLGMANTPTTRGTKVIMSKGASIAMRGPGYFDPHVRYTQRLTYGGEYLHAAPWNTRNIKLGVDSSNGCTNLLPSDAQRLYQVLRVGDVVKYPDADGPPMTATSGFADWNIPWRIWAKGGLIPTS